MGKLKPIGSEKLDGLDKINRILEIANYKLNIPKSINEDKSLEFAKTLADGNSYFIIKEKVGYVIKKGLTESTCEYIEPIKNRKFYPSYSQALKRLNLITKEVNSNEGYSGNISLFNESDNLEKRYFLKTKSETNEQEEEVSAAPVGPQQAAVPAQPTEPMTGTEELPAEPTDELGTDTEMEMEDLPEPDVEGMDGGKDEMVTFKTIQKLTGKLAQKIRTFTSDEENQMSSQDVKYVINSILSALDLNLLEPEDAEEIVSKFEGEEVGFEDEGEIETQMSSEDDEVLPEPEMGYDEIPEPPVEPEGEMAEMYPRHNRRESFEERQHKMKMKEMGYGVSESKIEKILNKYFNESPINENENKIERLSESFQQEVSSKKFVNQYPNTKFLGKTKKGTLVFEMNGEKYGVTTKGKVL